MSRRYERFDDEAGRSHTGRPRANSDISAGGRSQTSNPDSAPYWYGLKPGVAARRGTIQSLPSEVLVQCLSQLPIRDLGRAFSVCKTWNKRAKNEQLWRQHTRSAVCRKPLRRYARPKTRDQTWRQFVFSVYTGMEEMEVQAMPEARQKELKELTRAWKIILPLLPFIEFALGVTFVVLAVLRVEGILMTPWRLVFVPAVFCLVVLNVCAWFFEFGVRRLQQDHESWKENIRWRMLGFLFAGSAVILPTLVIVPMRLDQAILWPWRYTLIPAYVALVPIEIGIMLAGFLLYRNNESALDCDCCECDCCDCCEQCCECEDLLQVRQASGAVAAIGMVAFQVMATMNLDDQYEFPWWQTMIPLTLSTTIVVAALIDILGTMKNRRLAFAVMPLPLSILCFAIMFNVYLAIAPYSFSICMIPLYIGWVWAFLLAAIVGVLKT